MRDFKGRSSRRASSSGRHIHTAPLRLHLCSLTSSHWYLQASDSWAGALLLQLLSGKTMACLNASPEGSSEYSIHDKTTELVQLVLGLRCMPVHERPSQAARLESRISSILRDIAGMNCADPKHISTKHATVDADGACKDLAEMQPQSGHELEHVQGHSNVSRSSNDDSSQLSATFHLRPDVINSWSRRHFSRNEASASRKARPQCCVKTSTPLLPA